MSRASRRIAESARKLRLALARRRNISFFFTDLPSNESSVLSRVCRFCIRHEHCVRSVPRGKLVRTIYFNRTDETSFFSSCHHDRISIRFVRCFVKHAHDKYDRCADELSRNSSTPLSNLSLEIRLSI